jgi:signal peptidase I
MSSTDNSQGQLFWTIIEDFVFNLGMQKQRKPWVAVILSFVMPSLGHVYSGAFRRAGLFYGTGIMFKLLWRAIGVSTFTSMIVMLVMGAAYYFAAAADAWFIARRTGSLTLGRFQKWYVYLILIVISGLIWEAVPSGAAGYKSYSIPSRAMVPTILKGDRLMVNLKAYDNSDPQRGDIVVFKFPQDEKITFIKRVIAIPGDEISQKDTTITINGKPVSLKPASENERALLDRDVKTVFGEKAVNIALEDLGSPHFVVYEKDHQHIGLKPVKMAPGEYFVMGDNRDNSNDSRFWGTVPRKNILGKAAYLFLPLTEEEDAVRWDRLGKALK